MKGVAFDFDCVYKKKRKKKSFEVVVVFTVRVWVYGNFRTLHETSFILNINMYHNI